MKRGTLTLTKEELLTLVDSTSWENISDPLAGRLKTPPSKDRAELSIFLSEEDAESILDAMSIETEESKKVYGKIQEFLTYLRTA